MRDVIGATAERTLIPRVVKVEPQWRVRADGRAALSSFVSRMAIWNNTRTFTSNSARPSSRGTSSAKNPAGWRHVRYVDSSLERLQVKARGLAGDRFAVTCNGHRVPLHPTGTNSGRRGGRALSERGSRRCVCIRPSARTRPLRFDLYDTWNQRSLGGCTYHVAQSPADSATTVSREQL